MRFLLAAALALAACQGAPPVKPPPPEKAPAPVHEQRWLQPRAVVIRHATILPASGPAIEDGAIAFAEGKILAVGKDVTAPAGAEEIDGKGAFVTPGLIDAHSHLGVYATPSTFSTNDGNEATAPVTAEVNAKDSYWPQDPGLRRAAAGGITSMLILPGSANLIGGRGFPVKLHFGRTSDDVRFPGAKDALKMACGENPKRVYGKGRKTAPSTRMGNVAGYRQAFAAARDYAAKWDEWRRKGGTGPSPSRELRLETLAGVLKGEILVQNHCYRADEMETMLDVAREFGFHIRAFHHAIESYKVRDILAREGVGVAVWADWWGGKLEMWDTVNESAGLNESASVRVAIHSDSADGIQRLNQEAGKALAAARAAGLQISDDAALRWITLNPAWIMGVDDRTGSLEPGKMADIVLWNRQPFSVYARAQRVWADGVITYDARTGPADVSDFELSGPEREAASLIPHPAAPPQFASTPAALLPVAAAPCTAIEGATGVDGKAISIVLRGGRISTAPGAGCRVVDARGQVLAPGFIDAWSELGLVEISGEESANDTGGRIGDWVEHTSSPIHASLRAFESVNPSSLLFPVARLGGITAAASAPGGGLVSGQAALVGTDGRVIKPSLAMVARLGLSGREALHSTHGVSIETLRELFDDAREYAKRRQDFEQNRFRKVSASRLDLEALQPVLAGKLPFFAAADRQSDILAAIALAREYGLKLVLVGAAEGWLVAKEIAQAKVPVIVEPTQDLPANFDALASRMDNTALLAAAGVKVLISGFGRSHEMRNIVQEAGNAVAWGLPWAEAIKALSSNVADALALEGMGRIAEGARADVVLWSGDPLELNSRPLALWVNGEQQSLITRQTALFEKYRTVPK